MSAGYPLVLDLADRRAVVVGGGRVALRRTRALVAAGAEVTVVAPEIVDELAALPVRLFRRRYQDGDLTDTWLVHACTDDPDVNAAVAGEAERLHVWCVRADAAAESRAHVPAVTRDDGLTVAVHSGGDPRRSQLARDVVRLALHATALPERVSRGWVALVGGGPGDAGLVTARGLALLARADTVIVDKLAPRSLLSHLRPGVEVVDAGKAPHAHNLTQEQINQLLVDRALEGRGVVRLKGGDPYVFGRGGEEALACVAAGVPVEVVPGVTSAVAVPASAGIPVTHRGITQEFTVVSAHLDPSHPGSTVDWQALAESTGTLVLLMAVSHLHAVCAELVKRGRSAQTPAAVVSDGTTSRQRVLVSTLGELPEDAVREDVRSPAVVVVGDVVRLREALAA